MDLKSKLRYELVQWLWGLENLLTEEALDSDEYDEFELKVKNLGCEFAGHQPERDQCGLPAQDYCFWCNKSMPNSWKPPGE